MFARYRLERKVDALNYKVDLILQHLGIENLPAAPAEPIRSVPTTTHPGFSWAEIDTLLLHDKKIQAIKRYRELTGAGLKDAKDAVESRQRY
ncbi:50S ribosomal protein L7/L12 [Nocardia sp. NPDC046473]|uniref:50S ribosomal protein L7/L12 n=1 Tax=Nocardia sp. NPDC046473 TaxID=3155733 RepID=UPI0033F33400